ncbi:hypothetical protein CTA1_11845 [Colletotrichum tanaceti]|uniref:Uncharacterized protein n=1 Tax=Colletotrichum tanaceti TaxID=1306861 RepID=A0A4U6X8D2_9PEZI|nr:hypothetical protein CTA1_11845 [Colletotrichum tanaceti]
MQVIIHRHLLVQHPPDLTAVSVPLRNVAKTQTKMLGRSSTAITAARTGANGTTTASRHRGTRGTHTTEPSWGGRVNLDPSLVSHPGR